MSLGQFVEQQESHYQAIVQPTGFLARNSESVSVAAVISQLQNMMHASFTEYLGAGWLYPFLEPKSYLSPYHLESYITRGLLEMRPVLEIAVRRFGLFAACRTALNELAARRKVLEYAVAAVYKAFYEEFAAVTAAMPGQTAAVKPACPEFRLDDYPPGSHAFLRPLASLSDDLLPVRDRLCGFYLHGSLATGDFVPHWSDVDTLVVVRNETLNDLPALVQLRHSLLRSFRHFFAIDPLQLHGYFVIVESDLFRYPQTYFPLVLFDYARSFYPGDSARQVSCRDSQAEALGIFWQQVKSFAVRAQENRHTFQTNFERKAFLHNVFSFPLYLLQAKGEHCYKRDSFARARSALDTDAWNAVDLAANIMRSWDHAFRLNRWTRVIGRLNPKLWMKVLNRVYDSQNAVHIHPFDLLDQHAEELVQDMGGLSVCAWKAIRNEADACLSLMGIEP